MLLLSLFAGVDQTLIDGRRGDMFARRKV